MRIMAVVTALVAVMFLGSAGTYAVDSDRDGCMKISFSSLPFLGDSEKEGSDKAEYVDDRTDKEKYTYNAMGQKVPVSTERDGDATPLH